MAVSKPTEKLLFIREDAPARWVNLASIALSELDQILPGAALLKSAEKRANNAREGLASRTLPQQVR